MIRFRLGCPMIMVLDEVWVIGSLVCISFRQFPAIGILEHGCFWVCGSASSKVIWLSG